MSHWNIHVVGAEHPSYHQAFALAQHNYRHFYGATLSRPASTYFVYESINQVDHKVTVEAAMSITQADQGPLFSERYLERPLESYLPRSVSCRQIIEVGSLASRGDEQKTAALMRWSPVISFYQYQWEFALITITPIVEQLLIQNNLVFWPVSEARIEALSLTERGQWGSYYEQKPQVCLIDIRATLIQQLEIQVACPPALVTLAGAHDA